MSDLVQQKVVAAALNRLKRLTLTEAFDASKPESRPTIDQLAVFNDINRIPHRYVRGGNQSGKSQVGAREVSWVFTETHPFWKRRDDWADEPLLIIVMGRTSKQIEETLWRKIKSFLPAGSFHETRQGGALQKVEHIENGNTIIFMSHHSTDEAREKAQSYVAHYVWLDEMPGSVKLIEELHRRIQARRGYFLSTFTPKVRNEDIRKLVDACREPYSKLYKLKMFDNPVYDANDKLQIMESLSTYSQSYRDTILEGDWLIGEFAVYDFNYELHVEIPTGYSPTWRHVLAVDPALKSQLGFVLFAQNPITQMWYLVKTEYVSGILNPTDLVRAVENKAGQVNIVRRVSDPHEVWYIQTAAGLGYSYVGVHKKNERKGELIKNTQNALGTRFKVAPWCTDAVDEFSSCQWSERADNRIVNASSYHIIDATQYGIDNLPADDKYQQGTADWATFLRQENEKRKKSESQQVKRNGLFKVKRKTWTTRVG